MPSMKSRLVIMMLKHGHLLQGQLKRRTVIDMNTSILDYREETDRAAGLISKPPEGIDVVPVQIGDIYAEWIQPPQASHDKVILYFHGGGYVCGSCRGHRQHVAKFVKGSGVPALLFEYRLAPEHPYPAALDDALAAYRWLLDQGIEPSHIVFAGDSAGGGLALATMLAAREEGTPLPAGAAVLSPWTDLKCTGDSIRTKAKVDPFTPKGAWEVFSHYYTKGSDAGHPWISPLYGDLAGLPPVLIAAGDHDGLFDDSTRFVDKAQRAGTDATLIVGEGLFHCYPVCAPMFPEATQAMDQICTFIATHVAA